MLSLMAGTILILSGIVWSLLAVYAASLASRQAENLSERIRPMLYGLLPIVVGLALIVWR